MPSSPVSPFRRVLMALGGAALALASPVLAQLQAVDADLVKPQGATPSALPAAPPPAGAAYPGTPPAASPYAAPVGTFMPDGCAPATGSNGTYRQQDLIGAAEGVFGTGAKGLAEIIQDTLHKQGQPNGYIVGREAGGAFAVGLRYGSGTLCHRTDGKRPVYWTGPSIGFDAGGSAAKTFVLVYNLNTSEGIFHRFAAGEGQAYLVGGLNVSYLRYGDVVLIPVRMGVGLRLGVNAGYMKLSRRQNWFPF